MRLQCGREPKFEKKDKGKFVLEFTLEDEGAKINRNKKLEKIISKEKVFFCR